MELRLSWVDAHIDARPLKDCSRCIRWQEGEWHPEKQTKVEGRPHIVSSNLSVESLQTTCSSPSITVLQLKSFFIITAAHRETQRPWATEQLLLASPEITYYLRRRGPISSCNSPVLFARPLPLISSVSHCQISERTVPIGGFRWESLSAIFYNTLWWRRSLFTILCREFNCTSNHRMLL